MNKLLLKAGAVALVFSSMIPAMTAPAFAQEVPPTKDQIIEYCRQVAAENAQFGPGGFGGCVGFWNSYPNALPAKICDYYRYIGLITNQQFHLCLAYFKDQGL